MGINSVKRSQIEKYELSSASARKLSFLLGKGQGSSVLLIGSEIPLAGSADLNSYFCNLDIIPEAYSSDMCLLSKSYKYDVIFWNLESERHAAEFRKGLVRVRELLVPDGTVILVAKNKYSIAEVKKWFLRVNGMNLAQQPILGLRGYRSLLKKCGFEKIRLFLPMPTVVDMEELVCDQIRHFQLPDYFHFLLRWMNGLGLYARLHQGYFFFCHYWVRDSIDATLGLMERELSEKLDRVVCMRLDRFDLRPRGALVLCLTDTYSDERFVIRVAVTDEIDRKIGRNAYWTKRLQEDNGIRPQTKKVLPAAILRSYCRGVPFYVERMIDGIVAWKVAGDVSTRQRIDAESIRFLTDLSIDTERCLLVDEAILGKCVDEEMMSVGRILNDHSEFQKKLKELANYIKAFLLHQELIFVIGHGDFGYGNILVDANNGRVNGVIDWDGAREIELLGVDLMNFLIQKTRYKNRHSYADALKTVWDETMKNRSHTVENYFKNTVRRSNGTPDVYVKSSFLLASLRYIIRAATYPDELLADIEDYRGAINWLNGVLRQSVPIC